MYESDEASDFDELLFGARILSDRLRVVAHSHSMRFSAVLAGLYVDSLALAATLYICIREIPPSFRFGEQLYQAGPLLLIFLFYVGSALGIAIYRLSLDRMYLRLMLERLQAAIAEADNVSTVKDSLNAEVSMQ